MATMFQTINVPMGNTFMDVSDSWAKSAIIDLLGHRRGSPSSMVFVNFQIKVQSMKDFTERADEVILLYKESENMTREMMDPIIQTAFFDTLIFDETKDRYQLQDAFYKRLRAINRMADYIKSKDIIDYIIGITDMMKKQDNLIQDFYMMSVTYLRHGKTTPLKMLKSVLDDMAMMPLLTDTEVMINKIYFLATNIDTSLKHLNKIVSVCNVEILDIISYIFKSK